MKDRMITDDSNKPKERWCIHASAWVYDDAKEHDRREALDELNLNNPPDDHLL